jgi:hypothetical protein
MCKIEVNCPCGTENVKFKHKSCMITKRYPASRALHLKEGLSFVHICSPECCRYLHDKNMKFLKYTNYICI